MRSSGECFIGNKRRVAMGLTMSSRVREKLAQKIPPVTEQEIVQCFANRCGKYLEDDREQNATDPPTKWFIAETDYGRKLKICFIYKDGDIVIKTAYDPNVTEKNIYDRFA
jgi:hypothetical protein